MLRMKNNILIVCFLIATFSVSAQDILGKWRTVDEQSGEKKSIVEIYEKGGKVFGKIVEILNPDRKDAVCTKCEGEEKNKPINGLVIIKEMKKDDEVYKGGTILDPEKGKKYKCRLQLTDNPDILQVRGYVAFLYRNQYWQRIK